MNTTPELFPAAPAAVADRKVMNGKPVFTVPTSTVLNLDSGFKHKLLCDGPTFSTGSACTYSCAFCYVPDMMRKLGDHLRAHGVPIASGSAGAPPAGSGASPETPLRHDQLVIRRADAISVLRKQLAAPKARALADKPLTIYSSPLVDVAGNLDLVRETVEACKVILELTNWQIRLLSKSNLLPKVAEALEEWWTTPANKVPADNCPRERLIYGVSTGTLDDKLAQAFEAGAPLVSKRIASLHWLQDHGFRTFGMICPSLPQIDYAAFARDMAVAIRAHKCEHVWAEVINVRGDSFTRTHAALNDAGFRDEAARLLSVCTDTAPEFKAAAQRSWERYARDTFEAHARIYCNQRGPDGEPQLRFLQYVTAASRDWWKNQETSGAILL